jgi:type I protein arginine methyltransferase
MRVSTGAPRRAVHSDPVLSVCSSRVLVRWSVWDSVYGFNMKCIKQLALIEPLVDTCNPNQIISEPCKILDIDLYTVKKPDLDFRSNFELKINRDDYCHALVAYFDVEFSKSHTKIKFSTGPRSKYTHWKQTVFYLNDEMVVNNNDTISGSISVKVRAVPCIAVLCCAVLCRGGGLIHSLRLFGVVQRNAKNPRDIDIQVSTKKDGAQPRAELTQSYRLR